MSRYVLRADDAFAVTVGWDDPLNTYFAQVYDVAATVHVFEGEACKHCGTLKTEAAIGEQCMELDDELILWTGTSPSEVLDADAIVESVREWAPCPPGAEGDRERLLASLRRDQEGRVEPTALQRQLAKDLGGVDLP